MSKDSIRGPIVRAPLYPTNRELANAIRAFDGEPVKSVRDTFTAISEQTGTPQNPVDWSNPNTWINERLSGEPRRIADKIWKKSEKTLNPRHAYGCFLFINRMELLEKVDDIYHLGDRGSRFLANDQSILRELDSTEGIPKILSLVAERSPCKHGALLPEWSEYLKSVSTFSTQTTFRDTLRRRLANLVERELIDRDAHSYAITSLGLDWLKGFGETLPEASPVAAVISPVRSSVAEAAHAHNQEQQTEFRARLMSLEPAQFEHFVKELLDAMDYEDVRVTKQTGDKGVDVVARVQFGITEITEVVQVKRTEHTITRPKIDELRGALPYHKAIRGTIISLGGFAKGAQEGALYAGAAPITLIDGKRLIELCIKHQVGIKRRPVEIYEIDNNFFEETFPQDQVIDAQIEAADDDE